MQHRCNFDAQTQATTFAVGLIVCGRYSLATPHDALVEAFGLGVNDELSLAPHWNVAPTQPVAVILWDAAAQRRKLKMMRWGLGDRMLINLRAETAAEKFAQAYRARRCLVPADGFYEWKPLGKRKQPYYYHLPDGSPFAFAGLWEEGPNGAGCAILTIDANPLLAAVHDRMPALIAPGHYAAWLDPANPAIAVPAMPTDNDKLVGHAVRPLVNDPRNDGPELTERASVVDTGWFS